MIFLNENQLQFVKEYLKEKELSYQPLEEELLDHIATQIESKMIEGLAFSQAANFAFESFQEDEMKEIQSQIIQSLNYKQLIMKRLALLFLAVMLVTSLVWSMNFEPPSRSPLDGNFKITSGFGKRLHPIQKVYKNHKGIDFKAPIGTSVYATSNGKVVKAVTSNTGYGNHIWIQHDDEFQSVYAQLSEINVEVGQEVKRGDFIGKTGNSGASTAPHLHYEVRKNGEAENPEDYMKP